MQTNIQKNIDVYKGSTEKSTDINVKSTYKFISQRRNPEWSIENLIRVSSFDTCLIHNKSRIQKSDLYISKIPKWLIMMNREDINVNTGEIIYSAYQTDDFKAARYRKIKTVNKFCDFYEPLYKSGKVSLLFHTFTRVNYSKKDMILMMQNVRDRYKSIGRKIRGYLWVLEVSENNHIHYHLIVAVDRVNFKKIPEKLKFEDLWGQRTQVEFIRKSIRAYLSKYLSKGQARLLGKRTYAISRRLL